MEACNGKELFDEICERRRFTENDVKHIAIDLLGALQYLHSKGIAHRDIKPENIMFVQGPEGKKLKLIDFGFARNCDENDPLVGASGSMLFLGKK